MNEHELAIFEYPVTNDYYKRETCSMIELPSQNRRNATVRSFALAVEILHDYRDRAHTGTASDSATVMTDPWSNYSLFTECCELNKSQILVS